MKFTTLNEEPNMGKVWSDDKSICYGLYGQVGTLLDRGILTEINTGRDKWVFIPKGAEESGQCEPMPTKESLKAMLKIFFVENADDAE